MFDRLVTRAGMQMPVVRTVLFDAHGSAHSGALPSPAAFIALLPTQLKVLQTISQM